MVASMQSDQIRLTDSKSERGRVIKNEKKERQKRKKIKDQNKAICLECLFCFVIVQCRMAIPIAMVVGLWEGAYGSVAAH